MANTSTEQRKSEFVEATVRVIAKHGVSGATTRRIADEAGSAIATLHYCFTHKSDLFLEVFRELSLRLAGAAPAVRRDSLSGTAGDFLRASVDWMITHETFALAQLDLYVWLQRSDQALAQQSYAQFFDSLMPVLREAAPHESDQFLFELAGVLVSMLDGLTVQWFSHRDIRRTHAQVELQCRALEAYLGSRLTTETSRA